MDTSSSRKIGTSAEYSARTSRELAPNITKIAASQEDKKDAEFEEDDEDDADSEDDDDEEDDAEVEDDVEEDAVDIEVEETDN
jgi:hypothetical protein